MEDLAVELMSTREIILRRNPLVIRCVIMPGTPSTHKESTWRGRRRSVRTSASRVMREIAGKGRHVDGDRERQLDAKTNAVGGRTTATNGSGADRVERHTGGAGSRL
jgi:hypothetical protein